MSQSVKSALELQDLKPLTYPASVIGAIGTSALVTYLTKRKLDKQVEETQKVTDRQARNMLSKMGIPAHMPIVPYNSKGRNAFYVGPSGARKMYRKNRYGIADSLTKQHKDKSRKEMHDLLRAGLVAYHPDYLRKGIIAHELGHAYIGNRPWYSPSKINQGPLRTISHYANVLSPLATLLGASITGGATYKKTKNPLLSGLAGSATGLGLAALINAPTLLNEQQASNHARAYLKATVKDPKKREPDEKALRTAYRTYLLSTLAAPTLYGAALGGVGIPNTFGRFL